MSVYSITMYSSEDEKLAFYLSLKEHVCEIPWFDKVMIQGGFYARAGKDDQT